jgi:peptidoglycan/xylan/chitin deacetylase (PgdA/CDA1 family)
MFHHFHQPGARFGQGSITANDFDDLLTFVGRDRLLPAEEWYRRAVDNTLGKDDLCLTFDDNLMCQYEIAVPVLESYGLTGFFFIYSSVCRGNIENLEVYRVFRSEYFESIPAFYDAFERNVDISMPDLHLAGRMRQFDHTHYLQAYSFYTPEDKRFRFIRDDVLRPDDYSLIMDAMIERMGLQKETLARHLWMDDNCLRTLKDKGHIIGLHSDTHPTRLCALTRDEQAEEYRKNYNHIAQATGAKPVAMSHPCNSYNGDTLEILGDLGIRLGFCADMSEVKGRGPLEFPRTDHADIMRQMRA